MMRKLQLKPLNTGLWLMAFFVSALSWGQANPKFTAINPVTDELTITNLGDESIDVGTYFLCLGPGTYVQINNVATTSTTLGQNESIDLPYSMNETADGLSLFFTNTFGSSDPAILLDFVQWGAGNQPRVGQAVTAGRWDNVANFVMGVAPYTTEVGGSAAAWMGACEADAASIQIVGGVTEATICANDGVGDPIDVEIVGMGVGANNGWVITDQATGEILGLPPGPPFDLEGVFAGVCDVWYIRYADGLTGLSGGANIGDLEGCYDLSNPVSITRNAPDAAEIQIVGGGTEATICANDGVGDPIDVEIVGIGVGANNGWVITDQATGEILGLPPGPPFDLEGVFAGVCDVWYIRYEDGLTGLMMGANVGDLEGCYDLSNPVSITRNAPDAAEIQIVGGGTEATICANDGVGDPIDVEIVGVGVGANNGWVITDQGTGEILGLPPGPPFDLEGVFAGVCDVWYIRYEDGLTGLMMGANVGDLEGCYDLSNPVSITRNAPDAAEIQLVGGGTETDLCIIEGTADPIDVEIVGMGVGTNNGWVITDQATGEILGLPAAPPFNVEGAGSGVCEIWYIRYADGLEGLEMGANVGDLEGCFDLSNPVIVDRQKVDAAAIQISGTTDTEISVCAGDGEDDFIDVEIVGEGIGANNGWLITDNATGEILAVPASSPFNVEGAGEGVCSIWYIRYADGLEGLEPGANVSNLVGCFDLSNPIEVTRLTGDACDALSTSEFDLEDAIAIYPNPVVEILTVETSRLGSSTSTTLYDTAGRLVREMRQEAGVNMINVSDLTQGVYFLSVVDQNTGNQLVKKVVKN